MSEFINAMEHETNFTRTENGAVALKSTKSDLLDFFGEAGGFRTRFESDIEHAFSKAFVEDNLLATKALFYTRNIRGEGLGERKTFRVALRFLAMRHPEIVVKNLENILFFGRADDLYSLVNTPVENYMWDFVRKTFHEDLKNGKEGKPVSLLAKWLYSVNGNENKIDLGKKTAKAIYSGYDLVGYHIYAQYRKDLSYLRKYIDIVERKMSSNDWEDISYPGVPSRAMSIYRNAFKKHDKDRFEDYIGDVKKGTAKINSGTLFPYDILQKMGLSYKGYGRSGEMFALNDDAVLEEQWKALPNYVEGENNILVMADTSGSMTSNNCLPLATSVGLAMYFAERNHGPYKNKFMTFSSKPSFVTLKGETLRDRIKCVPEIVENTNIEAAFNLILNVALSNHLSKDDMPKALIIISDMQFDRCVEDQRSRVTFHQKMVDKFNRNGYEMPDVVFWNVGDYGNTFQVTKNDMGVQLVSGHSASIFKGVLSTIGYSPYEAMIEILSNPLFDRVVV